MRRRTLPAALAGAPTAVAAGPAVAGDRRVLHVRPGDSVQTAVDAVDGPGRTIVVHPGTYREVVQVPAGKAGLTIRGATRDPHDTVVVFDNANGTKKPDGTTYGTAGSATFTSAAAGLTVRDLTPANDWLRADHPDITGTQAVAAYLTGDRTHFDNVRLLAHQDALFADTTALGAFDRMYFRRCHIEGDVDFVFGRATAVFEECRFHTLPRDVDFVPKGMVFAPSTARANPHGFLAVRGRVTSGAEDGAYKIARPWVPLYETTAWPSLVVRDTWLGPGIDAVAPYTDMRDTYPWQSMRSGIATPAFKSTDASTTYNSRQSNGSLPVTTLLTTGSTTIGATMN
ncbi:pectinesterase family protein [Streptomyces sp. NPDC000987]|uniref:pectinesterase family protein n=1 Tax=Streptomyces sp. NPDC000987 TaxID=3154374 RepID=UPI003331DF8D